MDEKDSSRKFRPWQKDNPFASDIGKPYRKILFYGHIMEVYEFEGTPIIHHHKGGRTKEKSAREDENWSLSRRRARWKIMRLANANFHEGSKFVTLTFSDQKEVTTREGKEWNFKHWRPIDYKDITQAHKCFEKFIMRLRKKVKATGKELKYLAVVEFQDKNGRGAIHYHMLCNIEFQDHKEFTEKIWGHGFVGLNRINHVDNVGAYISAYLTEDITDKRLKGKKAYLSSHNLDQPEIITADDADALYQAYELDKKNEVLASSYDSEYYGQISYKQYNLKRQQ